MGCLYKLTSPIGKSYIGITSKSIESRWRQHRYNANKGRGSSNGMECEALYNAIRKYGSEKFKVELLVDSNDWKSLCSMEVNAIMVHNTLAPNGYNLSFGGEGSVGAKHSEHSRAKMSAAQKLRLANPEQKKILLDALRKAVKIRRQNWWNRTAEERKAWGEKHSKIVSAGHSTPECRAASSKRSKELWQNSDYRLKNIANRKNQGRYHRTEEWKRNLSELRRREWSDPIMRQKRLLGFARRRQMEKSKNS